jgi:hypothetical protein
MDLLADWISDINKTVADAAEKQRTPSYRQETAFCAHAVSDGDARRDLIQNPDDPFLFRKWLRLQVEESPMDIRECKSQRRQEIIEQYCGEKVINLLGCKCGNNSSFRIDPEQDWQYSSGQFNIKARKGPCSVWSGHIGFCWEGTMAEPRHQY